MDKKYTKYERAYLIALTMLNQPGKIILVSSSEEESKEMMFLIGKAMKRIKELSCQKPH